MSEAQLFERLGRALVEIEDRSNSYATLLDLLAKVVSGEIDPSRVIVNLTDKTWGYAAPGERPPMPATINGLPKCVVAPPKEVEAPNGVLVN